MYGASLCDHRNTHYVDTSGYKRLNIPNSFLFMFIGCNISRLFRCTVLSHIIVCKQNETKSELRFYIALDRFT